MNTINFEFNKKEYNAAVNLNVIIKFSRERKLNTVSEFAKRFDGIDEDLTFDQIEDVAALFFLAIREGKRVSQSGEEMVLDDCRLLISEQPELIGKIIATMAVAPAEKTEGENPQKPGTETANSASTE
jgi:hypothetical protein